MFKDVVLWSSSGNGYHWNLLTILIIGSLSKYLIGIAEYIIIWSIKVWHNIFHRNLATPRNPTALKLSLPTDSSKNHPWNLATWLRVSSVEHVIWLAYYWSCVCVYVSISVDAAHELLPHQRRPSNKILPQQDFEELLLILRGKMTKVISTSLKFAGVGGRDNIHSSSCGTAWQDHLHNIPPYFFASAKAASVVLGGTSSWQITTAAEDMRDSALSTSAGLSWSLAPLVITMEFSPTGIQCIHVTVHKA